MALDRSSATEITAGDRTMDISEEKKLGPTSSDVPSKKKKFAPLRSLKKFFAVNKKKKSKEEVRGVGLKSSSCDVLEMEPEEGSSQLTRKNTISMSADSVFSGERQRDDNIDFSRSMDDLPGTDFKDELSRKLQGRRSDDDEGFPSSPPAHTTTVDALIESGLKEKSVSIDSEHSLMSVDSSETELEDFFSKHWTTRGSHLMESSQPSDVDLDAVASTTSLNMTAAKHKIAVKPKNKSRSSVLIQRRTMASPKATASIMVLPKLKEESQLNEGPSTTHDEDVSTSQEELDSGEEKSTTFDKVDEQSASDEREETDNKDVSTDLSDKLGLSSENEEGKECQEEKESEQEEEKEQTKEQTGKLEDSKLSVILRSKEFLDKPDSSKRLTIAGESFQVTSCGRGQIKRSSLFIEEKAPESGSEFASVFARFQKQASGKKLEQDKKTELPEENKASVKLMSMTQKKQASPNVTCEQSKQKTGKQLYSVETSHLTDKQKQNEAATALEKDSQVTLEKKDNLKVTKPRIIIIEKSNNMDKDKPCHPMRQVKQDTEKRSNMEQTVKVTSSNFVSKINKEANSTSGEVFSRKENVAKKLSSTDMSYDSGRRPTKVTAVSSKYVSFHQKAAGVSDEKKTDEMPKLNASKKSDNLDNSFKLDSVKESQPAEKKRSVTEKATTSTTATSYKRESPRLVNRLRSQTLPDSGSSKDLQSSGESAQIKRTNSQDTSVNKENIPSSSDETSPKRHSVLRSAGVGGRPLPQKLNTGSGPPWIELAKKRTGGWDEDEKESENKTKKTDAEIEMAEKRASVFDLVKRFQ